MRFSAYRAHIDLGFMYTHSHLGDHLRAMTSPIEEHASILSLRDLELGSSLVVKVIAKMRIPGPLKSE